MSGVADAPMMEQRDVARERGRYSPALHPVILLTAAAIALRLLVFLGRGDYIAFDEGWYLLLGRSVARGDGYTLSGLVHTTLSPLFPLLAAAASALVRNDVWAGRAVAAAAGGLLVWPCWSIFARLAGRRVAFTAAALIAVTPSLTAFAAPYWIGWDLWVGAEPLLHLFLFGGIALVLRARSRRRWTDWALAGACFAVAFLARPEAILPFGLTGLAVAAAAILQRSRVAVAHALICALAFGLTAAPYWIYLHDSLGRWTLTGRAVELPARTTGSAPVEGAAMTIEGMLWGDDQRRYVQTLYGLNASATALSSTYWGVPAAPPAAMDSPAQSAPISAPSVEPPASAATTPESSDTVASEVERPARWRLYVRTLLVVIPWYLWPFIGIGLFGTRTSWRDELLVALPLALTSLAVARIVAADPRTQLFLVPLALFYAARGIHTLGAVIDERMRGAYLRRGFAAVATATVLGALLLATSVRWVYLGLTLGSPHHLVGAANRSVGEALRDLVPADEPVMSWHPALALYADRDWRVLPHASFADIVRYANAVGCEYIVLSSYYPAPEVVKDLRGEYLVLHVPPGIAGVQSGWQLQLTGGDAPFVIGRLRPAPATQP